MSDITTKEIDYEREQTTFYMDFSIADVFGISAVKDTYNRAFEEWKSQYKYLTELVLVINHKSCEHYNKGNMELSELYSSLYYAARDYALDNLKGEEMDFFFRITN